MSDSSGFSFDTELFYFSDSSEMLPDTEPLTPETTSSVPMLLDMSLILPNEDIDDEGDPNTATSPDAGPPTTTTTTTTSLRTPGGCRSVGRGRPKKTSTFSENALRIKKRRIQNKEASQRHRQRQKERDSMLEDLTDANSILTERVQSLEAKLNGFKSPTRRNNNNNNKHWDSSDLNDENENNKLGQVYQAAIKEREEVIINWVLTNFDLTKKKGTTTTTTDPSLDLHTSLRCFPPAPPLTHVSSGGAPSPPALSPHIPTPRLEQVSTYSSRRSVKVHENGTTTDIMHKITHQRSTRRRAAPVRSWDAMN